MALRFNEAGSSVSPLFLARAAALTAEIRLMVNLRKAAEYASFNFGPYGFDTLNQMSINFETRLKEIIAGAPNASSPEKWLNGVATFVEILKSHWPYFGQAKTKMENVQQLVQEVGDALIKKAKQATDWAPWIGGGLLALWIVSKRK